MQVIPKKKIIMASAIEEYAMRWKDHAYNFSHSFSDLLEQNELIDVTLCTDGYSCYAHRLVLSALSPYFRQMFTSMPANQQAFGKAIVCFFQFSFNIYFWLIFSFAVFMKDVSKQTLEHLITFIYRGEVNVNQENLDEFFTTAKALEIKGLADENYVHSSIFPAPEPTWSKPLKNALQYQSSQTVPMPFSLNSDPAPSNDHEQQDNFDDDYQCFGLGEDDSTMDQQLNVLSSDQCDANHCGSGANKKQMEFIAPKPKRMKRATPR